MGIIKGIIEFRVVEGELYSAGYDEDGGQIVVFDSWVEADIMVGEEVKASYAHFLTFKGSFIAHDGFPCPNYSQLKEVESLMGKMVERGYIDTKYWKKIKSGSSLEERWATDAYYEGMAYMGHGNLIPQSHEYLNQ